METSKLAILLLNWNGLDVTKACVDSLLKSKTSFSFDIYIIDNGSQNNEYQKMVELYADKSIVKVIAAPENLGFTNGNNKLIEVARAQKNYDYFFLLNNDTEVDESFLERFMQAVGNEKGIFGPQVRYFENPTLLQSIGGNINLWTGICSRVGDKKVANEYVEKNKAAERDYIFGCAILISREVVEKIGLLFSNYFIYYEEVDYCVAAHRQGFAVRYLPVEAVLHKDSITTKKISGFHIYLMWRNRIIFLKRHSSLVQYLVSFLYVLAYLPYFAVKYGLKEARFLLRGTIDGVKGKNGNPMKYMTF